MNQSYPSVLLDRAVEQLSRLPSVGRKSALRLALFLLRQSEADVEALATSLLQLRQSICYCRVCHNISDSEVCAICSNTQRKREQICVVENVQDVMAIENTQQFNGLYHVLGGVISPMNGVGPSDLQIASLVERVAAGGVDEVIMALSPNMDGDTTAFYIYRKLAPYTLKITTIARGVAVGDELEFADEVTLGRSIRNRVDFDSINHN